MKIYGYVLKFLAFSFLFSPFRAETSSDDKIIFVHIPKSGGVSVSSLLMNEYRAQEISDFANSNIKLYAYGMHFSLFEINKMLNVPDFKLITFLRNPIDRVLSEHRYCMGIHQGNPGILSAHRLPTSGDPIFTASNVVCKMLSGLDDQDLSIPIEKHLQFAKHSLKENFNFVGITEKMEESIVLLYDRMGWKTPEKIPHFNSTSDDEQFSDEILQGIAKRNWADIELYSYALELFEHQKNQNIVPQAEVVDWTAQISDSYHYTFDQELKGYGWGVRNLETGKDRDFRWVDENNEAGIDFRLERECDYSFSCVILIQPYLQNQFVLLVNDNPISMQATIPSGANMTQYTSIIYRGVIPQKFIKKGEKTRIVFKVTPIEDPYLQQFYKEDNQQQNIMLNFVRGKFACKELYFEKK